MNCCKTAFFILSWVLLSANTVVLSQPLPLDELAKEKVYKSYDDAFNDAYNVVVMDLTGQNINFHSVKTKSLVNLQVLLAAGNPGLDFDQMFTKKFYGSIPYLQILNLQENQLHYLPPELATNCSYLKMLYLGKNRLKELPNTICYMDSLQILSVHHNLLRKLPDSAASFKVLKTLDISGNKGFDIEHALSMLSEVKTLSQLFLRDCGIGTLTV